MNQTYTRYQMYLNSDSVQTIDSIAEQIRVNRSFIVRDLVDSFAKAYQAVTEKKIEDRAILLECIGKAKSKTGRVAQSIDEIYNS